MVIKYGTASGQFGLRRPKPILKGFRVISELSAFYWLTQLVGQYCVTPVWRPRNSAENARVNIRTHGYQNLTAIWGESLSSDSMANRALPDRRKDGNHELTQNAEDPVLGVLRIFAYAGSL
jgi:hypothetical protein